MDIVTEILKEIGPSLSSRVVQHLLGSGLSQEAARKRVSRANGIVRKLKAIHFPNRETFLFLEDQAETEDFRNSLMEALIASGSC